MAHHRRHAWRACSPLSSHRPSCRASSFRRPIGRSCVVDLTLPQNASIFASDTVAERLDAFCKGDPDVERWSTYVGRGAIRFYLPLDVKLPNDFFSQAVVVAKDVAARDRLQAKLEKADVRGDAERRRPRFAARARTARRLAGPVPGERSRSFPGALDRPAARRGPGRRPAYLRKSASTGWSRLARSASPSTRIRRGCWD